MEEEECVNFERECFISASQEEILESIEGWETKTTQNLSMTPAVMTADSHGRVFLGQVRSNAGASSSDDDEDDEEDCFPGQEPVLIFSPDDDDDDEVQQQSENPNLDDEKEKKKKRDDESLNLAYESDRSQDVPMRCCQMYAHICPSPSTPSSPSHCSAPSTPKSSSTAAAANHNLRRRNLRNVISNPRSVSAKDLLDAILADVSDDQHQQQMKDDDDDDEEEEDVLATPSPSPLPEEEEEEERQHKRKRPQEEEEEEEEDDDDDDDDELGFAKFSAALIRGGYKLFPFT